MAEVFCFSGLGTGFALNNEGTLVQWGYPYPYSLGLAPGMTNLARFGSGSAYTVSVIGRDGHVYGLSNNISRPPAGLSNVVSLAQDELYFAALVIEPQITAIERTNQQTAIRFPTFSGQQYTVQSSPNLSPGSWTNLVTVPGTGFEASVTDMNAAGSARFYRLRQP